MFKWSSALAVASVGLAVAFNPGTARAQQEIETIVALPSPTLTFSAAFLAEDAGFYKQAGLKVSHRQLVGVAAVNAVIAGSADFTIGTGPVFLRAVASGQKLITIANLIDKPLVELVMRKDVADAAGLTDKSSFADRTKALKGKTIAIQGVGSIIHAWERYVVARAGFDVENDVRIAPMDPPAMRPAMLNKAIDGFATSLPFTTEPVFKGEAVMIASAVTDAPELLPFAYGLVQTKAETCQANREKCLRLGRAYNATLKFMHEKPKEALDMLRKRFPQMDAALLEQAWKTVLAAHATDARVNEAMLRNSEKVNVEAKLLKPEDVTKDYKVTFTDEYVK
jgi:ABC-type nitrate/sulfonate/bicarbonate transport system substrate-binding protein